MVKLLQSILVGDFDNLTDIHNLELVGIGLGERESHERLRIRDIGQRRFASKESTSALTWPSVWMVELIWIRPNPVSGREC